MRLLPLYASVLSVSLCCIFFLFFDKASAQPPGTPAPILRTTLDAQHVVVGQPVTLRIELLVPNYLTAPPAFPELQLRNAVTRPLGNLNLSETHDGITYAGIRHEVAIHPLEPGGYAITSQRISFTYAAEPPRTQGATLALPPLAFEATIPDAAQGLDPFIAATRLTLRQAIDRPPGDLKVGDAVTRTVTVEAEGIPAMLLPPVSPAAPEGIAVYPAQPVLQDKSKSRSNALTATRIDRFSYMLERPGDHVLPGIDIAWWNLRDRKIEQARADPVTLHVLANPALPTGGVDAATDTSSSWQAIVAAVVDNWPMIAVAIGAFGGLAWFSPRIASAVRDWRRRRHVAWLQSEDFLFARLRHAAHRNDTAATYFALVSWLARFDPVAPDRTIGALRTAARDPALDRQLALIERRLFAPGSGDPFGGSLRHLLRRIAAARRRLRRRGALRGHDAPVLTTLNPGTLPASARPWHRRVAR